LLLSQFSAHPWALSPQVTLEELRGYAASPSFDELLYNLAYGETQQGVAVGSIPHPLVIGWGDQDRVCFPGRRSGHCRRSPTPSYTGSVGADIPQWTARTRQLA
jgi:hypothetical protein